MFRNIIALFSIGLASFPLLAAAGDVEGTKPVNLESLNSDKDEDDPHLSSDGLHLLYTSNARGKWTIMASTRKAKGTPWPGSQPFPDLEGMKADVRSPFLTPENIYPQHLYYATNKDENFDAACHGK